MKTKKVMAMLLCAAMGLSLLSGCGNDGEEVKTSTQEPQQSEVAEKPAEEPVEETVEEVVEEVAEELSGTITVCVPARAGAEEGWKAVSEAYREMHPDVDIVIDLKDSESYADWVTTVVNSTDPAVDIAEFGLGNASALDMLDYADYLDLESPYSGGIWRDQFDATAVGTSLVTGEQDTLSLNSTQVMWMYNVEIFEKAGVEPPETWDELIAVCEKLQAAGYQPITIDGDYFSFTTMTFKWLTQVYTDQITRSLINVYRAQEGDYCYDPDIDGAWSYDVNDPWNDATSEVTQNIVRVVAACKDGTYSLDTEENAAMWTNFAKVFPGYAGGEAMFGTGFDNVANVFYQGKAAMMINGGWGIIDYMRMMEEFKESGSYVNENGEEISGEIFTLGTFSMPSMTGDAFEAEARTIEGPTQNLTVLSKDQEHNDLVMDFMMYYSSAEGMSIYLEALLGAGGIIDGPVLVHDVVYPEEIAKAFEEVEYLGSVANGYANVFATGVPYVEESAREFYNNTYSYFMGEIETDEFLDRAQENMDTYLPGLMQILNISDADAENPAAAPAGF